MDKINNAYRRALAGVMISAL
ncbi:MAG: hypothetical protein ACD_87C00287G0001, partial [uncultured bacterium]